MSLILGVTSLSLALILYRLLFRAFRSPSPPRWLMYWLSGDLLCCLVTGLFAFGVLFLVKAGAELDTAPVGIGESAIAAAVLALAWLALERLSERRRRAGRAIATPLAGNRAPAA